MDRAAETMDTRAALQVLIDARRDDQIVITNQGSSREWPQMSEHPLDFHFLPSAMGAAIPLGLGIALAQPQREVIVLSGDGSLLMNLGALVTVAAAKPANLTVVLLDNAAYAVTGCQKTAAADADVDFGGLALAAGWPTVAAFSKESEWRTGVASIQARPGPRFVWLPVRAEHHQLPPGMLRPFAQRVADFRKQLAT